MIPTGHGISSAPIEIVFAVTDESVKRRPFPIADSSDEVVLARVPVDVIAASLQVVFVANRVLPLPTLPDTSLAVLRARLGLRPFCSSLGRRQ